MNDTTRALSSLSIILLLLLLPAFTSFGIGTAAAKTDPPQLIKLTNGTTASTLLPDSRFLLGYNTVQGPSLGALAAWSTFSNGATNAGYASLLGSVPTAENVPGFAPGCIGASTACPSLDEGYIRTFVGSSQQNETMKVLDTLSGTSELIPLHSPATPANKCLTSNLTTVYFCNFLVNNLYASGGGAVGVSPFPHTVSSGPVYSNEVVTWNGGKWTQLTPNDSEVVSTPCLQQSGANVTFLFDPTVIGDPLYSGSVGPQNFMPGDSGHVAYAMTNYRLDTPSGGCSLVQHETSVVMYIDGSPLDFYSFPAPTYNATSKIYSCAGRCFGGFIGYTGNLVLYTTWTGTGQSNYTSWVYSKLDGNYQIPGPNLGLYASSSITDGTRLLGITPDTKHQGNNVVWVFDPGRSVVASNGTVLHSVYPLGSFGGAGLVGGAQPFGIDGNTALWYFTNSTGTYLQAYELYDQATLGGRLLPAVNLAGPPTYGYAAVGSLPIYYENGLAAWVGGTGNATDPLAIYVYNVKAAEAGQPSLSSLRLGAYGFTSVVSSSFSQGWFFINGAAIGDTVNQVYALNVTGLPGSSSTSSTSSSTSSSTTQSSRSSSSVSSQTSTALTTTGGGGDLIPGVPDLDLWIVALLALGAIAALLYYLFKGGSGPGEPPMPPGVGVVAPPGGAKTQKKKDCSKEKLAFDSALARFREQYAFWVTASSQDESWRGFKDSERVKKLEEDVKNAQSNLNEARKAYAACLGVSDYEDPTETAERERQDRLEREASGFQPIAPGGTAPTDEEKKREEIG